MWILGLKGLTHSLLEILPKNALTPVRSRLHRTQKETASVQNEVLAMQTRHSEVFFH